MVLFGILFSTANNLLFADHANDSELSVDAIERSLELEKHEWLIALIAESDTGISSFTTDGCSGGLSVGWEKLANEFPEFADRHGTQPPWQECCVTHDKKYHAGSAGTLSASESFERRKQADLDLKVCVIETGLQRSLVLQENYDLTDDQVRNLYTVISELIYRAVRVGGIPCTDQPWRWGYGWPDCRTEADAQ
jgi:hypothetical protein